MTSLSTAYRDAPDASSGPAVSRVERALLCDLLAQVGPSMPTLCEGWDTHHLAAHLWGREANPVRQVLSAVPALGDRSVSNVVAHRSFADLVDAVRNGPPRWSLFGVARLEPLLNGAEFFIHHEDVRRAAPGWEPRELPTWAQDQLWKRVTGFAKLAWRRKPTALSLVRTDTGERFHTSKGDGEVVITGLPGEIGLYLSGRRTAAKVDVSRDQAGAADSAGPGTP
jgi:uncharacterized protein (TIGR03085 family)